MREQLRTRSVARGTLEHTAQQHSVRPGVVRLLLFGAIVALPLPAAAVLNPSYESNFDQWTFTNSNPGVDPNAGGGFDADTLDDGSGTCTATGGSLALNGFPTDGCIYARIYSSSNAPSKQGWYGGLRQDVDLTGISSITFDASLEWFQNSGEANDWDQNFTVGFYIDGTSYWTANTFAASNYLNTSVDTSALSGLHTIEFRNTRSGPDGTSDGSNWFLFDNIRTEGSVANVPEPGSGLLVALGIAALIARRVGRQ